MSRITLHPKFTRQIAGRERNTLTHGLVIAIERFEENAKELRAEALKIAAALAFTPVDPDRIMVWPNGCIGLAEEFERQVEETRALLDVIQGDEDNADEDEPAIFVARAVAENGLD